MPTRSRRPAAALLLLLLVPPTLAIGDVAEHGIRAVVYCEVGGACPGVSGGDRFDDCAWVLPDVIGEGTIATCGYACTAHPCEWPGEVGFGVVVGRNLVTSVCDNVAYCFGASFQPMEECGSVDGHGIHYWGPYGVQGDICVFGHAQLAQDVHVFLSDGLGYTPDAAFEREVVRAIEALDT